MIYLLSNCADKTVRLRGIDMDVVLLSRIQFALTIMFHYLFPPLTIGLGIFLVYLEGRYLKTGDLQYETAAKFWVKVFALNFAIGVASGIVMEFQFGTNWAAYSRFVGDVFLRFSWSRDFWLYCFLAGTKFPQGCIFSQRLWWRWGLFFLLSGS